MFLMTRTSSLLFSIILGSILALLSPHLVGSTAPRDYGGQHMFLAPSSPFHRSLNNNQKDYYELFISPRDSKITLSKETTSGDVELFISLDPTNKYPSETQYTYTTKLTNRNWIELDQNDLKKACEAQSAALCAIYVAVIPQGSISSYSISLKKNLNKNLKITPITHLEDGKELSSLHLPEDPSVPDVFYFYAFPSEASVSISAYSEAAIYANILDINTDISKFSNINIPTNSSYDYTSEKIQSQHRIQSILSLRVETPMLVVMSVFFAGRRFGGCDSSLGEYSVLLDSRITPIVVGRQYASILHQDQYKYFVVNFKESTCSILVSAKSVDGQELSIAIASSNQDELPTIQNSPFENKRIYGSNLLETTNDWEEYGYRSSYDRTASSTWIIGVYGRKASEFFLLTTCQSQKVVELQNNKTEQVVLRSTSPLYVLYKPQTKNPISIQIERVESPLSYYVRQISEDEDFVFNLPNKTNYHWSNPANIDREACNNCLYLITIDGFSSSQNGYINTEITIFERQDPIIYAISGYPITSTLLPGVSHVITLSHPPTYGVYIAISSEAEKLKLYTSNGFNISATNYLWNTEIGHDNQTQLLKMPFFNTSQDSGYSSYQRYKYYTQINNPALQKVNYTLALLAVNEKSQENNRRFSIGPKAYQAIIVYASRENDTIEVEVDVDFPMSVEEEPDYDDMSKQGRSMDMKVYYWNEDASGVVAGSEPTSKTDLFVQRTKGYYRERTEILVQKGQSFKVTTKPGKFLFFLTNTADRALSVRTRTYTYPNELWVLKGNSTINVPLVSGKTQTYKTSFTGPGAWYVSGYSCQGANTYLSIQNGPAAREVNATILEPNQQHFYKAMINEGETTQMIRLAVDENKDIYGYYPRERLQRDSGFRLKSTFLPGATPHKYEFNSMYHRKANILVKEGVINVEIDPIELEDYDSSQDTIFYEVIACPNERRDLCGTDSGCVITRTEEFKIQEQNQTQLEIKVRQLGKYYAVVIARIKSQGQEIKTELIGENRLSIWSTDKLDDSLQSEPIKLDEPVKEALDEPKLTPLVI